MRKIVEVELNEILDVVWASETYWYYDEVLFDALASFLWYKISQKELDNFYKWIKAPYEEEDIGEAKRIIWNWVKKYFNTNFK